jgi:hypothetical protein
LLISLFELFLLCCLVGNRIQFSFLNSLQIKTNYSEPVEISIRKRTLLGQLPNALCLQLKLAGGDMYKIDAFVKFPLVLDLGPFTVSSNPVEFFGARHSDSMPRTPSNAEVVLFLLFCCFD